MKRRYSDLINELSDKELMFHFYMTQMILLFLSFVLGFLLFDHFSYLHQIKWKDSRILYIGIPFGVVVVIMDMVLMKLLPPRFYDDGGLNERIFRNQPSWKIVWITALVAFSEELLFRGIIQTKVGLIFASVIFAVIHYRYLFNWYLFVNIILLSFAIGLIYLWTDNLAVTIVIHFIIDFLLGIYIRFKFKNEFSG